MKTTLIYILAFFAAATGALGIGDWVVSSFAVPGGCTAPIGLAYDDTYLYLSDMFDREFYVLTETGSVVDSYIVGATAEWYTGITYGGGSLWAVGVGNNDVYEIDPSDGDILSSFSLDASNSSPHSLAYFGGDLYVSNDTSVNPYIYVYNTGGVLQDSFLSYAKYPAGLDIIERSGTDYIFNLGYADGYFVLHEPDGTAYPDYAYKTSSPDSLSYGGDVAFEESAFSGDNAHMWHVNMSDDNIYYLQVEWSSGIRSASLGEIKASFR
ncbi:MAG: hypothetical protein GY771_14855 [bacterium]|nr:hypothetical protein [bacterium]